MTPRASTSSCFTPGMPCLPHPLLALLMLPLPPQPSWGRGGFVPALSPLPWSPIPLTFLSPLDRAAEPVGCLWTPLTGPSLWPSPLLPFDFLYLSPALPTVPALDYVGPVTFLLSSPFGASPSPTPIPWPMHQLLLPPGKGGVGLPPATLCKSYQESCTSLTLQGN